MQILINFQYQRHTAGYLIYNRNGDIQDPLLQYNRRVQKYFTHTVFTIVSFKIKKINVSKSKIKEKKRSDD